jgi:hypothetical protein
MGTFDTTCKTCQTQYCSVGKWYGGELQTVGEGLCSSHKAPTTQINAMVLADAGVLYVGGTFQSRVSYLELLCLSATTLCPLKM